MDFRFSYGASECTEQLPHDDQNQDRPGSNLHDVICLGHKGKVFFHGRHIGTECLKKESRYRIEELLNDTRNPTDDTLKNPV